jgi:hypothetical protein
LRRANTALRQEVRNLSRLSEKRGKALAEASARLEAQGREHEAALERLARAHADAGQRDVARREASGEHQALLRERDALEKRTQRLDAAADSRVADCMHERRRLQEELRRAMDDKAQAERALERQQTCTAALQRRLDVVAQSLRSSRSDALPLRHLSPAVSSPLSPAASPRAAPNAGGASAATPARAEAVRLGELVPAEICQQLETEVRRGRAHVGSSRSRAVRRVGLVTRASFSSQVVQLRAQLRMAHGAAASPRAAASPQQPAPPPQQSHRRTTPQRTNGVGADATSPTRSEAAAPASSCASRSAASPRERHGPSSDGGSSTSSAANIKLPVSFSTSRLPASWKRQ